ncbi:hypothetical protein [Nostoc sp. MG11]|nr:hypothetical protein [Nostoc sp. MG11]
MLHGHKSKQCDHWLLPSPELLDHPLPVDQHPEREVNQDLVNAEIIPE